MVVFTRMYTLHDVCHRTLVSLNYTPPQKIKWSATAVPMEPVAIALPGQIDTIQLRSLLLNNANLTHNKTLPILISWRRFSSYKENPSQRDYFPYWCNIQQNYRSAPIILYN